MNQATYWKVPERKFKTAKDLISIQLGPQISPLNGNELKNEIFASHFYYVHLNNRDTSFFLFIVIFSISANERETFIASCTLTLLDCLSEVGPLAGDGEYEDGVVVESLSEISSRKLEGTRPLSPPISPYVEIELDNVR